jgi:hypothetical protein
MVSLVLVLAFDWIVKKSDSLLSRFLHPTEKISAMDWPSIDGIADIADLAGDRILQRQTNHHWRLDVVFLRKS